MKRFFFDNEGDDDEDDMMDEAERMMPEFIPEFLAMAHHEDPRKHLLDCSIRICERSLLWAFMGRSRKMRMIESVFGDLARLIDAQGEVQQGNDEENK